MSTLSSGKGKLLTEMITQKLFETTETDLFSSIYQITNYDKSV